MYKFDFSSMKLTTLLFLTVSSITLPCWGQSQDSTFTPTTKNSNQDIQYKNRLRIVTSIETLTYGGSLIGLNKIWYNGYPRSSFHFYNDAGEWLNMDKAGHSFTAYTLSRLSYASWQWAGVKDKKAILLAGFTGMGYQTIIETLDGFSSQWGWSWSDMASNTAGIGLWMGQELLWKKQKIKLKFSSHYNKYADPQLEVRNNQLFGSVWSERLVKDYNAQTYWLSANLHDFNENLPLPKWLSVAVGMGAENMFGGYGNSWPSPQGTIFRNDIKRYRQWYLSLDVDFEKIPTHKKWVKSLFFVLNSIKFPAPTLVLANGKWSSQWLYY